MYFNEYDTNNVDYSIKVIKIPPKGRFVQGDSLDFKTVGLFLPPAPHFSIGETTPWRIDDYDILAGRG